MIYIYDILLNFNESIPFEFFEWDENDEIDHLKKIPLYKVSRTALSDMLYGTVEVSLSFLNEIKDKTEIYKDGTSKKLPYVALFSDGSMAVAVEFSEKGRSIYKSRLLLDEEEEILEYAYDLKEITFSYQLLFQEKYSNETRLEKQIKNFLKQEFSQAIEEKKSEKIKYFYEECFDKPYQSGENLEKDLLESLNHLTLPHKKLYQLLKKAYQLKQ